MAQSNPALTKKNHWVYTTQIVRMRQNWLYPICFPCRKRWDRERVASEIAVKGSSTSNEWGDYSRRYHCKMVGRDFIEGDNNG